jgi:hypothetical protein
MKRISESFNFPFSFYKKKFAFSKTFLQFAL